MTAKEIREYGNVSRKLVEVEERSKLLEQLKKHKVCFNEEEGFARSLGSKMKILGAREGVRKKQHDEFVEFSLKYKLRDNGLYGRKLRKRRNWLRGQLEASLGSRSTVCRNIIAEVKDRTTNLRAQLKLKHKRKLEHLIMKYGRKKCDNLDMEVVKKMGNPRIFGEDECVKAEDIRKPVIVENEGEKVTLSDDEAGALMLGPKFCLYNVLTEEEYETNLEECIMKLK